MILPRGYCQIGCDPELIITVGKTDQLVAADRIVKTGGETDSLIIYDNVAVEFRPEPSSCSNYVQDNLSTLFINKLRPMLAALPEKDGLRPDTIDLTPVRRFPVKELRRKAARSFGCSHSLLADGSVSVPHCDPRETRYRCIGHHVHVGVKSVKDPYRLTRLCDMTIGILGVLFEHAFGWGDLLPIRRKDIGYGKAGEHRLPKHGYEYRTLSSWPTVHPALAHLAWVSVRDMLGISTNEKFTKILLDRYSQEDVDTAINDCDKSLAWQIRDDMKSLLKDHYSTGYSSVFFVPDNWHTTDRILKDKNFPSLIRKTAWLGATKTLGKISNYDFGKFRPYDKQAGEFGSRVKVFDEELDTYTLWNYPSHLFGWTSFCQIIQDLWYGDEAIADTEEYDEYDEYEYDEDEEEEEGW